jgi:hypothetical protein
VNAFNIQGREGERKEAEGGGQLHICETMYNFEYVFGRSVSPYVRHRLAMPLKAARKSADHALCPFGSPSCASRASESPMRIASKVPAQTSSNNEPAIQPSHTRRTSPVGP